MPPQLSPAQIAVFLGGIVFIGGLFVLAVYVLHRAFQRQRQQADLKPSLPRGGGEAALIVAALQNVIARLKTREKELNNLLREAEDQAEAGARTLETIARELPTPLLVFNREGFLTLANPAARALLEVDTWSRRRYPEILGPKSPLAVCLRECLERGKGLRRTRIEYQTPSGLARALRVSLAPYFGRSGKLEGVVCLFALGDEGSSS